MKTLRVPALAIATFLLTVVGSKSFAAEDIAALRQAFREPPVDARPMMRWWWFGPAVTKEGIERELRLMREGGIGGFEVQPVYPHSLDDAARGIRNLRYLSDEFLEALRFTAEKARELGLRFDLTLGTGWPYGGHTIPIEHAAARLRCDKVPVPAAPGRRVPLPELGAGESFIAAFEMPGAKELTDIREGALWLPENGARPEEVWYFVASRTGQQVKRAAFGAEGFVLDHYSRGALDHFLKTVGEPLLRAVGPNLPQAVFCDSLEAYGNDWTDDFLAEFQRRRGYDLKPHLPALFAAARAGSKGIEHDWARTLTELLEERFIVPLRDWAHAHGTRLRLQGYGTPPATISSNRFSDIIEGEGGEWTTLSRARWAASAGHIFGREVISSETWTWLHSPVFAASPLDMKAEADRHFLSGINQIVGHGWPYTPPGVEYPGWRFYAAAVFNEKNPWWIAMPDISRYLQRVSFLLRQGRPVADVGVYLPDNDGWAHLVPGNVDLWRLMRERVGPDVLAAIVGAGYNFDAIDDQSLRELGKVEGSELAVGAGRYRAVVLPYVGRIPDESLAKLEAFARAGGIVVATRRIPLEKPGFLATPADHAKTLAASQRLFEGASARGHFVADEKQLGGKLASLVRPDVALAPAARGIGVVHRAAGAAEIFFVVNTEPTPQRTTAAFRVRNLSPEWWDPMSGEARGAVVAARDGETTSVALDLAPYESRVLVFPRVGNAAVAPAVAAASVPALDLSADWQVTFREPAVNVRMPQLRSWTEDERTRFFSGVATYEKTFVAPPATLRNGAQVVLDFGEGTPLPPEPPSAISHGWSAQLAPPVREAAVVSLNGRRVGSIWAPPYRLDVTGALQPGENRLEIRVANLALNHLAGRGLPDYKTLHLRYGERFTPQDMERVKAQPAGLLGPIRLLAAP